MVLDNNINHQQGLILKGFDFYQEEFVKKSFSIDNTSEYITLCWADYTQAPVFLLLQAYAHEEIEQLCAIIKTYLNKSEEYSRDNLDWLEKRPAKWWFPLGEEYE